MNVLDIGSEGSVLDIRSKKEMGLDSQEWSRDEECGHGK